MSYTSGPEIARCGQSSAQAAQDPSHAAGPASPIPTLHDEKLSPECGVVSRAQRAAMPDAGLQRRGGFAAIGRSGAAARRGSAKIEYAVMLAFVAATVVLGWHMLGEHTARPLSQLALDLDASTPASRRAGRFAAQRGLPARRAIAANTAAPVLDDHDTAAASFSPTVVAALAAQIVCGVALLALLYRQRRRVSESETVEQQAGAQLDRMVFEKRQQMLHQLTSDPAVFATGQLLAHHLMSPPSSSVAPDAPWEQVVEQMKADRVRHLLVRDNSGRLVGIISDRDVYSRSGKTAADFMTPDPITINHDAPLAPALTMLVRKRISCLPVVREGGLCGVLTTTDVVLALQCILHVLEGLGGQPHPLNESAGNEQPPSGDLTAPSTTGDTGFAPSCDTVQQTAAAVAASVD